MRVLLTVFAFCVLSLAQSARLADYRPPLSPIASAIRTASIDSYPTSQLIPRSNSPHPYAVIAISAVQDGAVQLLAIARAKGARDCRGEANADHFPPTVGYRPTSNQKNYYRIAVPLALISNTWSWLAYKKHWMGAFMVPEAGTVGLAVGAMTTYAQGCT